MVQPISICHVLAAKPFFNRCRLSRVLQNIATSISRVWAISCRSLWIREHACEFIFSICCNWTCSEQNTYLILYILTTFCYLFTDVNTEEICSKTPVPQIKQTPLSDPSVLETHFNSTEDSDSGLWRTHLNVYRMTHASNSTEHASHTSDFSDDVTDDSVSTEDSNTDLSEHVSQDSDSLNNSGLRSSPALLSRQLSFGSYRSCPTPAGSQYYPFPHMKCLKKSVTARRLGMYSSF